MPSPGSPRWNTGLPTPTTFTCDDASKAWRNAGSSEANHSLRFSTASCVCVIATDLTASFIANPRCNKPRPLCRLADRQQLNDAAILSPTQISRGAVNDLGAEKLDARIELG